MHQVIFGNRLILSCIDFSVTFLDCMKHILSPRKVFFDFLGYALFFLLELFLDLFQIVFGTHSLAKRFGCLACRLFLAHDGACESGCFDGGRYGVDLSKKLNGLKLDYLNYLNYLPTYQTITLLLLACSRYFFKSWDLN